MNAKPGAVEYETKAEALARLQTIERHAENGVESDRTACGLVLLGVDEDGKNPAILAAPGNIVTCVHCRMILDSAWNYNAMYRRKRNGR